MGSTKLWIRMTVGGTLIQASITALAHHNLKGGKATADYSAIKFPSPLRQDPGVTVRGAPERWTFQNSCDLDRQTLDGALHRIESLSCGMGMGLKSTLRPVGSSSGQ